MNHDARSLGVRRYWSPLVSRIAGGFLALLAGQSVSQGLTLSAGVYLARVLAPESFGKVVFAQTMVSYFLLLGDMGLAFVGARDLGAGRGDDTHLGRLASLRLWVGLFSCSVLFVVIGIGRAPTDRSALVALFGLAVIPYALNLSWVFLGLGRMCRVGLVTISQAAVYVLLLLVFVRHAGMTTLVPVFFSVSWIVSTGLSWFLVVRMRPRLPIRLTRPSIQWRPLLVRSLPVFAYVLLTSSQQYTVILVLGWLGAPQEVALYRAAFMPVLAFFCIASIYGYSLLPTLAGSKQSDRVSGTSVVVFLGPTVAASLIVTWLSPQIVQLLYGTPYAGASAVLRLLSGSLPLVATGTILSMNLVSQERTGRVLVGLLAGFSVQTILALLLVPTFGARGGAVSFLAGSGVVGAFMIHGYARAWSARARTPDPASSM